MIRQHKTKHSLHQVLKLFYWSLSLVGPFESRAAVVAPPWADPKVNPCAAQKGGWQLLYWPPNGMCYKIFQRGHPCPEGMELSPSAPSAGQRQFSAECRCPPDTAQSATDGKCYQLFTAGPCEKGHYFAPDEQQSNPDISTSKRRWGTCKQISDCSNPNELFWPRTSNCYVRHTRGPCPKGQLVALNSDGIAECACSDQTDLRDYWFGTTNGCYQHFTKGPCKEKGHLYLPDRSCGCHRFLPHYHDETEQCFELGAIGPCATGEHFQLDPNTSRGSCLCKPGHIRYVNSKCYRPYTRGPCPLGNILVNSTSCIPVPCDRGQLYFPEEKRCYRVGTRGSCPLGQIVTFDFATRPSVDGVSYNGLCSCGKSTDTPCGVNIPVACEQNMLLFENRCYRLYKQGPCAKGAWVTPKREGKEEIWTESKRKRGVCECMPGYTKSVRTIDSRNVTECLSPTVILADYMNKYFSVIFKNTTNNVS